MGGEEIMPQIRFSHLYHKLGDGEPPEEAQLLQVFTCDRKDLSDEFVGYDTAYYDGKKDMVSYYPLPGGKLLVLVFLDFEDNRVLFTTIRRWTPEKEKYYRSQTGKVFDVVINAPLAETFSVGGNPEAGK